MPAPMSRHGHRSGRTRNARTNTNAAAEMFSAGYRKLSNTTMRPAWSRNSVEAVKTTTPSASTPSATQIAGDGHPPPRAGSLTSPCRIPRSGLSRHADGERRWIPLFHRLFRELLQFPGDGQIGHEAAHASAAVPFRRIHRQVGVEQEVVGRLHGLGGGDRQPDARPNGLRYAVDDDRRAERIEHAVRRRQRVDVPLVEGCEFVTAEARDGPCLAEHARQAVPRPGSTARRPRDGPAHR